MSYPHLVAYIAGIWGLWIKELGAKHEEAPLFVDVLEMLLNEGKLTSIEIKDHKPCMILKAALDAANLPSDAADIAIQGILPCNAKTEITPSDHGYCISIRVEGQQMLIHPDQLHNEEN